MLGPSRSTLPTIEQDPFTPDLRNRRRLNNQDAHHNPLCTTALLSPSETPTPRLKAWPTQSHLRLTLTLVILQGSPVRIK